MLTTEVSHEHNYSRTADNLKKNMNGLLMDGLQWKKLNKNQEQIIDQQASNVTNSTELLAGVGHTIKQKRNVSESTNNQSDSPYRHQ